MKKLIIVITMTMIKGMVVIIVENTKTPMIRVIIKRILTLKIENMMMKKKEEKKLFILHIKNLGLNREMEKVIIMKMKWKRMNI